MADPFAQPVAPVMVPLVYAAVNGVPQATGLRAVPQDYAAPNALPAAGLGAGTPAAGHPTTFAQIFGDESRDPCQQDYTCIMQQFDASVQGAVPEATLFHQVGGQALGQIQAYLTCSTGTGHQGPCIYCIHCPARFVPSHNGDATNWDDLTFAFLGKVVQGHITSVLFPNDAFTPVTVCTKTDIHMLQHIDDLATDSPLFPPVGPNDDQVVEVAT